MKLSGPFGIAIDQRDRIWITNAVGDTVTRFPASDPTKVEVFDWKRLFGFESAP